MSGLPPELIDRIIDHVHDKKSLNACSLVCRQWSPRSRKRLFVQIEFASLRHLERWCARIHPERSGLSSLVEDLTLSEYDPPSTGPWPSWLRPSILANAASHFHSFSGLRALKVQKGDIYVDHILSMLHSFGSSLENVTRLTLRSVIIHPSVLAVFVSFLISPPATFPGRSMALMTLIACQWFVTTESQPIHSGGLVHHIF